LVAGNTELGIDIRFKYAHFPNLVSVNQIPELQGKKKNTNKQTNMNKNKHNKQNINKH